MNYSVSDCSDPIDYRLVWCPRPHFGPLIRVLGSARPVAERPEAVVRLVVVDGGTVEEIVNLLGD